MPERRKKDAHEVYIDIEIQLIAPVSTGTGIHGGKSIYCVR